MKNVIFLDVDGVLNPDTKENAGWTFDKDFYSGPYRLYLSTDMGQAILGLDCQIQWLTTWVRHEDDANAVIGPALGWPRQKVATLHLGVEAWDGGDDGLWKPRSVHHLLAREEGPESVVWIDDDADFWTEQYRKACTKFASRGDPPFVFDPYDRLLTIVPDSRIGLTKKHIKQIKHFLGRRRNAEVPREQEEDSSTHREGGGGES